MDQIAIALTGATAIWLSQDEGGRMAEVGLYFWFVRPAILVLLIMDRRAMGHFCLEFPLYFCLDARHSLSLAEKQIRFRQKIISRSGLQLMGKAQRAQVKRNLADIEMMIALLEVLPFGMIETNQFGRLRSELYRIGQSIAPYDMMIA